MGESSPYSYLRLGALRVSGPDAAQFLRAQLTNDVARLGAGQHFLAAWCDAKGRTQLLLRVLALTDGFLLLVPRTLIPAAMQRLRLYVLRLKVELVDATDAWRIDGALAPDHAPPVNGVREDGDRHWLGVPTGPEHAARALVLSPADAPPPAGAVATDDPAWVRAEIDAGLPQITEATQGAFVPQMLNLHWLLGIDFAKGCYPGQEVIARLHYRGRLTRRVFRLAWQGTRPAPGDVVRADGATAGTVLQAAGERAGTLLAVVQTEAAARGRLQLADDTALTVEPLPYATPA